MRRLIICVSILCSCLVAKAEPLKFSFVGVETKTGWSDSWDASLRYGRIIQAVELRYRFFGWLQGYTYLVGQTGWMQVRGPVPEIKSINLYLYPNVLAGQGVEVKKPLADLFELAAFAEIYSSFHTAVATPYGISADLPKDSPGMMLRAYDTNVGELGFRAGIRIQKSFPRWSLRFGVQYELDDLDIFMNPKPWAFKDVPSKVSELDSTSQMARAVIGASVNLPKRLYLTFDASVDVGKVQNANSSSGIGLTGYGASAGLGYSF